MRSPMLVIRTTVESYPGEELPRRIRTATCTPAARPIAGWDGISFYSSAISSTILHLTARFAAQLVRATARRSGMWRRWVWIGIHPRSGLTNFKAIPRWPERKIGMIQNRELSMDDYLAMLRRRLKVLLTPALVAPLVGFPVSFGFSPKYTSQATILVEGQKVPEGYVAPVVTEDLTQRIATMEQRVLTRGKLQPMIERLGLAKGGRGVDDVVDSIRNNIDIQPVESVVTTGSTSSTTKKKPPQQHTDVPGFYVNFTANNPREAQEIRSELTSMLINENVQARTAVAENTTQFLARQLEQAKHELDDQDSKLAVFKKQYV